MFNRNLGLTIAKRLMDTIPETYRLTFIITSRTFPNVKTAINELKAYAEKNHSNRPALIEFDYICFDLTSVVSLKSAVRELELRYTHIDYVFFNAALGLYEGIDFYQAMFDFIENPYDAFTFAHFKIQAPVKPSEDGMGNVFQANVFALWYFVRRLTSKRQADPTKMEIATPDQPLLGKGSKIFWFSSVTANPCYDSPVYTKKVSVPGGGTKTVEALRFDPDDIELLHTEESYEAAKRELDLLHHATAHMLKEKYGVTSLLVQPGIFKSTTLVPTLGFLAYVGMMMAFYICRWFWGSPYHNIDPWKAAYAFVELAKDEVSDPDVMIKYGSATDRLGREYLLKEKVPGLENGYFDDHQESSDLNSTSQGQAYKIYLYVEALYKKWEEKLEGQVLERYQF